MLINSDLPAVSFLRLTHSEASEGYPAIVKNIQPCSKLCLLMPLARVGARTDSTSYTAIRARRGQFPRTRIGVVGKICCICCMEEGERKGKKERKEGVEERGGTGVLQSRHSYT